MDPRLITVAQHSQMLSLQEGVDSSVHDVTRSIRDIRLWQIVHVHWAVCIGLIVHPDFRVALESLECGTVVWDDGEVSVDAIGLDGEPVVEGASLKR